MFRITCLPHSFVDVHTLSAVVHNAPWGRGRLRSWDDAFVRCPPLRLESPLVTLRSFGVLRRRRRARLLPCVRSVSPAAAGEPNCYLAFVRCPPLPPESPTVTPAAAGEPNCQVRWVIFVWLCRGLLFWY
eukprot:15480457-Alexandrium_andersonii.AAC.1